ncbi:hypothetical protein TPHA_0A02090 [Tetrapisispora phaffii CBS 4417]|uniref:RecA family profile 1 domain-containing protein n=1 Tax=Tetrapisispora phaffii (strain ATCC 24235 / CBS 4417 / NBRC 1672 / NRRL Y-8282 / UCD 70-5) TaxID=1071381 RepID=G8BN13_TETPH|nr:hypothetical protein TPHA_0A02090 [Tetrapisispora phaffii CBS 4417]CCE61291.1 hypothetical protein TPHA_0A02090 [Tetrapisispora phaffii CBS 4417]
MSFGVSLSQLISSANNSIIKSGIDKLDEYLGGSFQNRSIYEIYGPPGIGKTRLGVQIVNNFLRSNHSNKGSNVLWIDTNKTIAANNFADLSTYDKMYHVQITKISELTFFFTKLLQHLKIENEQNSEEPHDNNSYKLIIIDGFSNIINNHLNYICKRMNTNIDTSIHEIKCRHLIMLLTVLTKFTHSNGSTVIFLNNCMNTAFSLDFDITAQDNNLTSVDGSNFLVRSATSNDPRKSVQVLKSELVSNIGIGTRDSRWEVFIKNRIGLFWDWEHKGKLHGTHYKGNYNKLRVAIISNIEEVSSRKVENKERDSSPQEDLELAINSRVKPSHHPTLENTIKVYVNDEGEFCSSSGLASQRNKKRSKSPDPTVTKKKQSSYIDFQSSINEEQSSQASQATPTNVDQSFISTLEEANDYSDIVEENDEIIYDSEG